MYEAPIDAWYVWLGLAVASGSAFAVASSLPAAAPPPAADAVETTDRVAASQYDSVARHPLEGTEEARVGSDTLSLRGPGGEAHAAFGYGPVTPAVGDDRLEAVLQGEPPERTFGTVDEFERRVERAQTRAPEWYETDRLDVRRVSWGEVDVVLVG